ncbi:MAG TPA: hypothetical protein VFL27_14815 [Candidatus Dormibacteraeota bacterium]|nr:hypothetical protein [Candidatus Dormibacteraeota bacterium]
MLAQGTATLPYTSERVAAALASPDHPWSVGLDGDGRRLMAAVGVKVVGIPVYKHVRLKVGSMPYGARAGRVMLPVSWETTGGPPIFPKMEGTVHVEPAGPDLTRLTLNAMYDPPLGSLGALLDRALMHRLADMTMADFVERLAAALTRELSRG